MQWMKSSRLEVKDINANLLWARILVYTPDSTIYGKCWSHTDSYTARTKGKD